MRDYGYNYAVGLKTGSRTFWLFSIPVGPLRGWLLKRYGASRNAYEAKKLSESMSHKQLHDFAATSEKHLPEHKGRGSHSHGRKANPRA